MIDEWKLLWNRQNMPLSLEVDEGKQRCLHSAIATTTPATMTTCSQQDLFGSLPQKTNKTDLQFLIRFLLCTHPADR